MCLVHYGFLQLEYLIICTYMIYVSYVLYSKNKISTIDTYTKKKDHWDIE